MKKRSKRYKKLIEISENYKATNINEAIDLIKKTSTAKFDESIDAAFKINVKQTKAEVNLRTVVNLPHGNGKKIKIAVLCEDSKKEEAKNSGADFFNSDKLLNEINAGKIYFNKIISTPSMMSKIGKIGKILGPKGLMPNPKLGTVTNDIKSTVESLRSGQIEIRNDKDGNIGASIGKKSFSKEKINENFNSILEAIIKEKPKGIKGNYILSAFITSTMGISCKIKVKGT